MTQALAVPTTTTPNATSSGKCTPRQIRLQPINAARLTARTAKVPCPATNAIAVSNANATLVCVLGNPGDGPCVVLAVPRPSAGGLGTGTYKWPSRATTQATAIANRMRATARRTRVSPTMNALVVPTASSGGSWNDANEASGTSQEGEPAVAFIQRNKLVSMLIMVGVGIGVGGRQGAVSGPKINHA